MPVTTRIRNQNQAQLLPDGKCQILLQGESICWKGEVTLVTFDARGVTGGVMKMWTKCPDGIYRLDCVLENGVPRSKAQVKVRNSEYRLSIEGFGSFREPKTLKEINVILARHGLWPFRETSEQCPEHLACLRKTTSQQSATINPISS